MQRKIIATIVCIGMISLAACGNTEITLNSEASTSNQSTTEYNQSVESNQLEESQQPSQSETVATKENTSATQSQEEAPQTNVNKQESEAPYTNWSTIQEELESQNLKYQATYTFTTERLNVTVEDGTEMIFLHIIPEGTDETEMWTQYLEREPEQYALVMMDGEFYGDVFREFYLKESERAADSFYQPDASQLWGEITPYSLGQTGLSISRNQVFAKYGRKFEDAFLNAVFSEKSWYEPKYSAEEFVEGKTYQLTEYEQENLQLILKLETELGCRKPSGMKGLIPLASGSWLDLDGDGYKEQISYAREKDPNDCDKVVLTVQSEDMINSGATLESQFWNAHKNCYLAEMEGYGPFLVIAENGVSDDFVVNFFSYEGGRLRDVGSIPASAGGVELDGETINARVESFHFQCQPVEREYVIENGHIVEVWKDYYDYRGNTVTVSKAIPVYEQKGATTTKGQLEVGESVIVLGGDLKEWVQLERESTGERCWIRVEEDMCFLEDGTMEHSDSVFEGLTFYG